MCIRDRINPLCQEKPRRNGRHDRFTNDNDLHSTCLLYTSKTGLVVEARQQDIGPDTLKFGMLLGANLKGDSEFSVGAAYTMSALNRLGAQWRNFIQLGGNIALTSDFHQPLNEDQDYYLNPYLKYEQYNLDVFNDPYAASSGFRVYRSEIGLEAGRNLGSWGRLAFGVFYGAGRNDLRLGQPLSLIHI